MKISTALKHLFVPHEHNDYRPHFFREISVAIIVVGSVFMLGASFGSSFLIHKTVLGASVTANVLVDLTNESRVAYNEDPLTRSTLLDKAANLKASDMAANQYFAHNSPTGVTPWHWFQEVGYTFLYAGENLAINFIDANEVRDAWLASPTHRANLLDVKFKEIGMATIDGFYKDGPTIYVVQLFGTPAVQKAQASSLPVSTSTQDSAIAATETPKLAVSTQTPKLSNAGTPEIKGESKSNVATSTPYATPTPVLSSVVNTPQFVAVKNNETVEAQSQVEYPPVQIYSTWYERLLFGGTYYAGLFFRVLLGIVLVALITMLTIEFRRQHWKHLAYALALLLIISMCITINQTFW